MKKENMHTETTELWLKKYTIFKTIMAILCLGSTADFAKTWEVLMKIRLLVLHEYAYTFSTFWLINTYITCISKLRITEMK